MPHDPEGARKRLTGRDAPDLTASSSGRPPHHRRLRRVAPPAWPLSLADPAPVAGGVRRFLVEKPPVPQGFPRTSSDDHGLSGVSAACRLDDRQTPACQQFLSTECSTAWSPACPHDDLRDRLVRRSAPHAAQPSLLPRGSVRPAPSPTPFPEPQMNPSTALARVVVDTLVAHGVRELVLAPGSRSAPLALAALEAAGAGRRPAGASAARPDRRAQRRVPRARAGQGERASRSRWSRPRAARWRTCTPPCSRRTTPECRSCSSPPTDRRRCAASARTRPRTRSGSSASAVRLFHEVGGPAPRGRVRSRTGATSSTGPSRPRRAR